MKNEKEVIYGLMREIIVERRELSKQFYELKARLEKLENDLQNENGTTLEEQQKNEIMVKMPNKEKDRSSFFPNKAKRNPIPFERIGGYIVEILKDCNQPTPCRILHKHLEERYGVVVNYQNLVNNIMPKLWDSSNYPVDKAYRGYWQYRKK